MSTETPVHAKKQMSFSVLDDGRIMATFGPNLDPVYLGVNEVPEESQIKAIVEGLISRLRGFTSALEGDDRTPENLRTAVIKGADFLRSGGWKVERASGEGVQSFTQEIRAAHLFRKMKADAAGKEFSESLADVSALWEGLSEEQQKLVKATPRYQQALATIKAEDAAKRAAKMAKKAETSEDVDF